jgi:hypothetical protein
MVVELLAGGTDGAILEQNFRRPKQLADHILKAVHHRRCHLAVTPIPCNLI